jgi:hypothetical protein
MKQFAAHSPERGKLKDAGTRQSVARLSDLVGIQWLCQAIRPSKLESVGVADLALPSFVQLHRRPLGSWRLVFNENIPVHERTQTPLEESAITLLGYRSAG